MRRPVPPTCTVAASGSVLAWESDDRAGVLDLDRGGEISQLEFDDAVFSSVSPDGSYVAFASADVLTVLRRGDGWETVAEHELDEPLFRVAVDDGGLLVAVTAHDGPESSVALLFDGDRREEYPLGEVTVFTLILDVPRHRMLLAGQSGPGSFHGAGDPFARLIEWGDAGSPWSILWDGPAPLERPNGWLMPLAFGDIGVHDLDRLVIVSPDSNPDDVGSVVDELLLEHLETVAVSPDGRLIAWFWRGEDDDHIAGVRGARLADGTLMLHPAVDGIAHFPVIAVADDGCVTLADVMRPSTIRVRRFHEGDVETTTHVVDDAP